MNGKGKFSWENIKKKGNGHLQTENDEQKKTKKQTFCLWLANTAILSADFS